MAANFQKGLLMLKYSDFSEIGDRLLLLEKHSILFPVSLRSS